MAAAASSSSSSPSSAFVLFGLRSDDATVEEIEYFLGQVMETLSLIGSKRGALQEQIVAASSSRGNKCRASSRRLQRAPPPGDEDAPPLYTRRGSAGALRRRLKDAAREAKKGQKWLEAVRGELEEALVDAKERRALPQRGRRIA